MLTQEYFLSLEFLGLVSGVLYLLLIIREVKWAWPLAFVTGSAIAYSAFQKNLYMETALQVYYIVMAVVGWFSWNTKKEVNQTIKIRRWPVKYHIFLISLSLLCTFLFSYLLDLYTDQSMSFLDSFTTIFSLSITWMVTQKILENWIYWLVINSLNIYLMYMNDMKWMTILAVIYTLMSIQGLITWYKKYKEEQYEV